MSNNIEEKKKSTKIKVGIAAAIVAVLGIVAVGIVFLGIFRDFDAQAYTRGILNQTFKGDAKDLVEVIEIEDETALQTQYEQGVQSFVDNNIITDIPMDDELKGKYYELGKTIFNSMRYEVLEAEKINKKEYKVPVEFQSTDIFSQFTKSVKNEEKKLLKKVEKGEYKGTRKEINAQMQAEFLANCYTQLETLSKEMTYGEKSTMTFTVKADDNGSFGLNEQELYDFIVKIMGLDAIQD